MKFIPVLESLGLSKTEAKMYLVCLRLGPSTAIQLGQKVGVTRQMIYTLLPAMLEKGILKQIRAGDRRLYQAVNPEVLKDLASTLTQQVEAIIPELLTRQSQGTALPTLTVYENPASMREWYREMMQSMQKGEEMLIWSTNSAWFELDKEFYSRFIREKTKKGVIDQILCPSTAESKQLAKQIATKQREFRFLQQWWMTDAEMWVWRDQIVLLTIKEQTTNMIVVQSEALATLERFKFKEAWERLATSL